MLRPTLPRIDRSGTQGPPTSRLGRNLARKPDGLDHRTAAALPMVALTAQQALFDHGGLAPRRAVAVLGAGGGVGTFSVQLARAAGARVVALARPWASDLLRALGAEVFVDVDDAPLAEVDVVFDLVGGETLRQACAAVRQGATVVSAVEDPSVDVNRRGRFFGRFFVVEPNRTQLQELGERVVAGELQPVVGATWPLREGRAAFEAKQRGGQAGKAVLLVGDES